MTGLVQTVPLRRRRPIARAVEGQELALVVVIAALWLALSVGTSTFLTGSNLRNILFAVAATAIIGIGMTPVIVTGGIDVSVGSMAAVVMVVVAKLVRDAGAPAPLAVLVAVALGLALGCVNGLLVSLGGIHPIIVTFGTLNVFRFVALRIFENKQVAGVPDTLGWFGGGQAGLGLLGVPHAWWLAMVLAALTWCYMRYWATGRHWYAIGNDADAARLAGVRVRRRIVSAYALTGFFVGLAACVLVGSGGLVQQNAGTGLELQVIAAVVIGGTSILGGRGTVLGTLLGALLVGTVTSAITLLGWPSELTELFIGAFILVAVGVDLVRERRRRAR
ncbi:ABC transporter permease [Micromonospora sp. MA102]|jgi:ribose transport system permease protein|uniref:ABC transporter permease n=1 Tax=Micromonospora sp. MA102 TaxID=2952755 RepID=UPI0021C900B1|nr:ABC transporter permease [Micromonospora sp. MA102]